MKLFTSILIFTFLLMSISLGFTAGDPDLVAYFPLNLDENAFAVHRVLKDVQQDITQEQAQAVNQVFEKFSDYQWDIHQRNELRTMLYKTLRPTLAPEDVVETTNELLELGRVE